MSNPTDFPEPADFASGGRAKGVEEPIVKATIIVPESQSSLPPSASRARTRLPFARPRLVDDPNSHILPRPSVNLN